MFWNFFYIYNKSKIQTGDEVHNTHLITPLHVITLLLYINSNCIMNLINMFILFSTKTFDWCKNLLRDQTHRHESNSSIHISTYILWRIACMWVCLYKNYSNSRLLKWKQCRNIYNNIVIYLCAYPWLLKHTMSFK